MATSTAIIQARMGSSRLPGKTLINIAGQPLLGHIIDRVKTSKHTSSVILATTTAREDDPLVDLARQKKIMHYRGSATDVLDRFYQAARQFDAQLITRITADDPFKDPDVIDLLIDEKLSDPDLDYVTNTLQPTYPEGLDVEVFSFRALERAWGEAHLASEREHVTPYIWKNPALFKTKNIRYREDLSKLRWTIDYEEDIHFTREIYRCLYTGGIFKMHDILALLEAQPELGEINRGIQRNEGYIISLNKEQTTGKP